uniref:ACB domain-containing protein n=1 Tax=Bursaphelenchus xylophilus TaxID=6326 RepID=A0A1I7SU32_BURXY
MSSIQDFEKNLTPVSDEVFNAAVELVQNMPKDGDVVLSNEEKLSFYGLFKQATLGQCRSSSPGIWHVVERYKWDAWSALGSLEPSKAKSIYVHNLQNVMDKVLENRTVHELLSDPRWLHIRPIVEPKFKILGRTIDGPGGADSSSKPCSSSNGEESVTESAYSEALISNPGSNVVSDDEYVDARGESPVVVTRSELSHSPLSSGAAPEDPMSRSLTSDLLNSFQMTTNLITQQIQTLNSAFNQQNKVLQRLFDKLNHYRIITWPLFIFLLIWPVLVQMFIRYMFRSK